MSIWFFDLVSPLSSRSTSNICLPLQYKALCGLWTVQSQLDVVCNGTLKYVLLALVRSSQQFKMQWCLKYKDKENVPVGLYSHNVVSQMVQTTPLSLCTLVKYFQACIGLKSITSRKKERNVLNCISS